MHYFLSQFSHIRPRFEHDQKALLEWTAMLHETAAVSQGSAPLTSSVRERLLELGSGRDKIQKRGFLIRDPFIDQCDEMTIYPVSLKPEGVEFKERMLFFDREVSQIFEAFYARDAALPSHLIHVTCTGYVAPSPAQKLVSQRDARGTTVTHAYHMGCYASIPAIRMGAGMLSLALPSPAAVSVDIVHTEVCSLHLHPLRHSIDQLIVQSLFADGFIKYSVQKEEPKSPAFKVLALLEEIIPDSINSMTWNCDSVCHAMTLDKNVPVFITRVLEKYLERLAALVGRNAEELKKNAYFAIHPGGPKILFHIQHLCSLGEQQIAHSMDVLQNFGNMSSATLPHIWEKMLCDLPDGALVVSLAFGPGLSIVGALFEKRGV